MYFLKLLAIVMSRGNPGSQIVCKSVTSPARAGGLSPIKGFHWDRKLGVHGPFSAAPSTISSNLIFFSLVSMAVAYHRIAANVASCIALSKPVLLYLDLHPWPPPR
ncbi:hypothetical protein RRG08_048054 [Elysia crispata]|uniref:Uncharacterized protein n=1 Tax=Elysia crispata TaxID=231223 RepID=A0AAE0Z2U8_9GAST|nr:hypothetical protein RRG08_048054 [Elysia crispata]